MIVFLDESLETVARKPAQRENPLMSIKRLTPMKADRRTTCQRKTPAKVHRISELQSKHDMFRFRSVAIDFLPIKLPCAISSVVKSEFHSVGVHCAGRESTRAWADTNSQATKSGRSRSPPKLALNELDDVAEQNVAEAAFAALDLCSDLRADVQI